MLQGLESRLLGKYKNIKRKLISINWNISWAEENEILKNLVIERSKKDNRTIFDSLYQFKAQTHFLSTKDLIVYQLMSFGTFFYLIFSKFFLTKSPQFEKKVDVVFFFRHNIYSDEVRKGKSSVFLSESEGVLEFSDIKYLFKLLWIFKFNFGLLSTATYRISQIKYAKKKFNVSEVWSSMEYSCACGIAFDYVCKNNIVISNFMHGEKVLTLRDTFCVFHNFYVWEDHYINLFKKLACKTNFIIDRPWKVIEDESMKNKSVLYFLKGIEDEGELDKLNQMFKILKNSGYSVSVKDHPRQPVVSHFLKNCIIIPKNSEFLNIFNQYNFIAAQYSTVLNQAYFMNRDVLIDDYSNGVLTNHLKERDYYFYSHEFNVTKINDLLNEK